MAIGCVQAAGNVQPSFFSQYYPGQKNLIEFHLRYATISVVQPNHTVSPYAPTALSELITMAQKAQAKGHKFFERGAKTHFFKD